MSIYGSNFQIPVRKYISLILFILIHYAQARSQIKIPWRHTGNQGGQNFFVHKETTSNRLLTC